ncbi:unnamed protein product, partial [Prorocentrum cordatum]
AAGPGAGRLRCASQEARDGGSLQPLVSAGTLGHPTSCGAPCKYVRRKAGCRDGASCQSCHVCQWHRAPQERLADRGEGDTSGQPRAPLVEQRGPGPEPLSSLTSLCSEEGWAPSELLAAEHPDERRPAGPSGDAWDNLTRLIRLQLFCAEDPPPRQGAHALPSPAA